jgi:hypothetical protein
VRQLTVATLDSSREAQPFGGQFFEQPAIGFKRR